MAEYTKTQLEEEYKRGHEAGIRWKWCNEEIAKFRRLSRIGASFRCHRKDRDALFSAVVRYKEECQAMHKAHLATMLAAHEIEAKILDRQGM